MQKLVASRSPFARGWKHGSSSRRRVGSVVIVGLTLSLATACGGATQQAEPEWPEQPSPSYPNPSTQQAEAPNDSFDQSGDKTQLQPSPSSSLAKQYKGKKALSVSRGKATYYADSLAGNHTANGDVYNPDKHTAAHKKLPFGSIVRVIREDTGAETYVRVNDRGPFGPADRVIDVSKVAAKELDMMKAGVVSVRLEVVAKPE